MHAVPASTLEESELVACCDVVAERAAAAAEKYGAKAYTDYREMLDREKLDAVHLCLPHYLHTAVAKYAFSRGVNVLSEKPMSIDYESAEDAVISAEKAGVLYGVIFQCRYNNSAQLVKRSLEAGKLSSPPAPRSPGRETTNITRKATGKARGTRRAAAWSSTRPSTPSTS